MKKSCLSYLGKVLSLLIVLVSVNRLNAQTTIATPYTGPFTFFASPANAASFVIENTNAGAVILTGVSQYCETSENNSVWELYYSATSLSGVGTPVPGGNWTLIATSGPTPVTSTGVVPVFTGLSFPIPGGTQYRFVMRNTGPGNAAYASDAATPSVNLISSGGINLKTGTNQIAGQNVGYSGNGTTLGTSPRYWHGAVTFVPSGPCTDPPIAGIVNTTANPACKGANFILSTSGGSFGTGMMYRWQSSSNNTTWTDIAGATNSTATVSQTTATYYRLIITCGTGSDTTNSLFVGTNICYCASGATGSANEDIVSVNVNGSNNASICGTTAPGPGSISGRYSNFYPLGSFTSFIPGITVDFNIDVAECDAPSLTATHGCAIWIDFNQDGDFADAGEQVYVDNTGATNPRTIFGNITVPPSALPGVTGMRIIVAQGSAGAALQPCMSYTSGETEDYLVTIIPDIPCTGIVNAGLSSANPSFGCVGQVIALNNTGADLARAQKYQWQVSTNNGATWTDIPGATSFTATHTLTAPSWYRFKITCETSGEVSYSSVAQVTMPPAPGGTYTINKNETNLANLFPNGPVFTSFNAAYDAMRCGISSAVTLNVFPGSGPYNEQLIMDGVIPNSSAVNTITFNGNGETITFNTGATERAVIKLKNIQYIRFDSLVIVPTGSANGFGVHLTGDANFNIIRNCTVNISTTATTTSYAGIAISGSETDAIGTGTTSVLKADNNQVLNNKITGGYYGMTLAGSFASNAALGNNRFYGNKIIDYYAHGIYVTGTFNSIIDSNFLSRPTRTNAPAEVNGIYFTAQSNSAMVSKNRITNPFGANLSGTATFNGINFNGTSATAGFNNNVINNLIYKMNGNGPITGISNINSGDVWYVHNTVSIDSLNTVAAITKGFSMSGNPISIYFYNNLISVTRNGPGAKHAVFLGGPFFSADNNNYYRSVTGATGALGFFGSDRASLGAWQVATGKDANSLSADPVFTNVNDGISGYKPGNGGLDNQGIYFGIATDILGISRPLTNPDIGAFEFTPPTCTLPVVNGTTNIVPAGPVCQQEYISLSLNIGPYGSGQNFQWQSSTTATGPWTNIGNPKLTPDTSVLANASLYYRAIVSCGASIDSSNAVLIAVNPALPAGTYTINKGLPTDYVPGVSGPGANFNSFNDAKAAMVTCGILGPVVFNVVANSGPYNEQLKLDSIRGVTRINTITFNGNGNTIAFNSTTPPTTSERAVIKLTRADHIIFDSLTIDAATGSFTFGYGVQLINNADSNIFRRNTILASTTSTSQNYNGIVINATDAGPVATGNTWCDSNTFFRNTIIGGYHGVTLVGSATDFIENNKFTNNTILDFYTIGIYIAGTNRTLIEGNTISRPTRTTVTTAYGIYATGANSQRLNITKNRINRLYSGAPTSTSAQYGIYHNAVDAPAGNDNVVSNNVIHDLDGNGIIYALYNTGSAGVRYYHNTVSIDNLTSTTTAATRGFYQTTEAVGLEFVNNIISIRRGGTGPKHGIYFETATSEIHSDYNDVYVDGLDGNNHFGYDGANRTTLLDWQTSTGEDAHSFSINPLFVDPASGNYSAGLQTINDVGSWVGIATDIRNINRNPLTPDIGAYEFAPPPCVNPPVTGTASATPSNSLCMETRIALNLTGHSPLGALKIQWQSAPTATGPWTNISPIIYTPQFFTTVASDTFFRASVICGNGSPVYSTVTGIHLAPVVFAGTYTIDNANPTTWPGPPGSNFNSFNAAVAAMSCGITGPVVFNVKTGTTGGVYNEQVSIPYIKNSSAVNTIIFQSDNGNAASINLTYSSSGATANYTLRLDSVRYVTFRNMTISATNTTLGRAVELAKGASYNAITNCIINAPSVTLTSNSISGIYANALKGVSNTIKKNTVNNGSMGIYFWGTGVAADLTADHLIDSNTVNGAYAYGINVNYQKRARLTNNTVNVLGPLAASAYGIYASDCDSSYTISRNTVTISNTTTAVYGIYVNNSDTALGLPRHIAGNTITGVTNNSGALYGLTVNNSPGHEVRNNVIALNTSSATTRGLHASNIIKGRYYNNSVNIASATGAATNSAAFFETAGPGDDLVIRNNIFSNKGSGRAMVVANAGRPFASDYNMLYAAGSVLVQSTTPAVSYSTLKAWITASYWDRYSIVYPPAFVSNADLHPNVASPDVWAMHGRGVQIAGNNYDFNNNPRPTTLTTGVPDLGAFEFVPTSLPTLLNPIPAGAPATGVTQAFMYGTDTVARITWGANVPPTAAVRRYSGVVPTGLAGPDSMYFYTEVQTPGTYDYDMNLFYYDPWQGSIPEQWMIGLGRKTPGNNWVVGYESRVFPTAKRITQKDLTYMNQFTGLINPFAPPVLPDKDSSNRGRRFWVAYAINQLRTGSNQEMVLYLSAQEPANVSVKINGTTWERNYLVPANTVVQTEFLPKNGPDNAFLNNAGLSERGIYIESDVPVVVYAHATGSASSGAAMLLPVSVWGYEYKTLGITQNYGAQSYSYFYAVADNDNTVIEVTPTVAVQNGGMTPGVPYTVTLNKGEVFQVVASSQTQELTGSTVKSIPNSSGVCYPVAVFSGTSRSALSIGCGSGGDFMMQQNFPATAWGKHYLTAPSSASTGANQLQENVYRIAVRDPLTVVKKNGTQMTGLVNGHYYEYRSTTGDYIESDKPIMVAQYLTGACDGVGDPEMIYISPIEQGIDKIGFYRNNRENIQKDLLTMIIPTNGLSSLVITDGTTIVAPDYVYPHPQNGSSSLRGVDYSVVVKSWDAGQEQVRVQSDSSFTAITYGLGSVESYGYNAGTLVKNINATGTISNTLNTLAGNNDFTCVGSTFKFSATLQLKPTKLTFKLSTVPNVSPNTDVTLLNPVPVDSFMVNWTTFYTFTLPADYTFSSPGIYPVQIVYQHPDIEGCDHEGRDITYVQVVPAPKTNFTINFPGCVGGTAQFVADSLTNNGSGVKEWEWTFHNGTSTTGANASFSYPTIGSYDVKLHTVTPDGCVGDSIKTVQVNAKPTVDVVQDNLIVCTGTDATFNVLNPAAGVNYIWYYLPTGGTPIDTTNSFTATNVTTNAEYYVEAVTDAGCVSENRKKVTVGVSATGAAPVVTVTATGADFVTFTWTAIPGSTGYQVSTDNGATFSAPSSGPTGLTHTASGLGALQTVTLIVKSLNPCGEGIAAPVSGCSSTPVNVVNASLAVCEGTNATFNVQSPATGITYTWYNALTGGSVLGTGSSFTLTNVTNTATYYVEQQSGTCIGAPRTPVVVSVLPPLNQIVATVDSVGVNVIKFRWNAVPGAAAYEVSTDGGITFITPSSGPTGLTHIVAGLQPAQQVTLTVRAIGAITCQMSISGAVTGTTWPDDIFIPNTFTPNGDGLNDVFRVYGYIVQEMNVMIFNQWGEKVFQTRSQGTGWDGTFNGKPQPSGVYIVVGQFILRDGSMIKRTASLNLIR